MQTIKTSKVLRTGELTGAALDWAVAKCEKQVPSKTTGEPFLYEHRLYLQDFIPSTAWSQGGPIIEREKIAIRENADSDHWYASKRFDSHGAFGTTPLIAAMRCYVASKLGDTVEVPDELAVQIR